MRRVHAPFESWSAAHHAASAAESALYARLRAGLAVSQDDLQLVAAYRAEASRRLALMLADMKIRASSLRVPRQPPPGR